MGWAVTGQFCWCSSPIASTEVFPGERGILTLKALQQPVHDPTVAVLVPRYCGMDSSGLLFLVENQFSSVLLLNIPKRRSIYWTHFGPSYQEILFEITISHFLFFLELKGKSIGPSNGSSESVCIFCLCNLTYR